MATDRTHAQRQARYRARRNVNHAAIEDALSIAIGVLDVIELGGSFTTDAWDDRMARIERAIGRNTARARMVPLSASERERE